MDRPSFWQNWWFLAFLVVASSVPLLWPETPPLPDVPAHMGRYRVQLALQESASLQQFFEFKWAVVGNLGVDILVQGLAPLFGLELAVKIIVAATPALTAAGLLFISKEIHGRVMPTAFFAIPFIYSFPFNYGFLNYSLAFGLALLAFGLWLRMSRTGSIRARDWLFLPISCALWVAHAFGWGILGLLAVSAELIRRHDLGENWLTAAFRAALSVVPMGLPIIVMVVGAGEVVGGNTGHFFVVVQKAYSLVATLRDRWIIWDSFGVAVGLLIVGAGCFDKQLGWSRRLAIPTIVLALTFFAMPARILGLTYADLRLAPVVIIVALLAIRTERDSSEKWLAVLGLTFMLARLAVTTVSFAIGDREMRGWLTALDHMPRGTRVLFFTGEYCDNRWELPRQSHMGSFVIVRRDGFSNDQWQATGAQLLRIKYTPAGRFKDDRSSLIFAERCVERFEKGARQSMRYDQRLETAMWTFPRDAFDYVWLIDVPGVDPSQPRVGLPTEWRGDRAVLYRIDHHSN